MTTDPVPVADRKSEVVDLTEGMSDLDVDSGAENDDDDEEAKSMGVLRAGKKKRKGHRGGKKTKRGRELDKARKLKEALHAVDASDGDAPSSRTLSEAESSATGSPFQPHDPFSPPVHVPVLPHYAIRPIPSSTTSTTTTPESTKSALFATQPLPAGTRIIRESALITLPFPGDDPLQLIATYHSLPASQQQQIMSLNASAPTASPFLTHLGATIMTSAAHLISIRNKPLSMRTPDEQATLDTEGPKLASTALLARLAARWHAGRRTLIDLADTNGANLPPHVPITGLFIDTARLGQSCMPNCYARYDTNTGEITVHTLRDVAVGEKLNLSAMRSVYYRTAAERKKELAEKFGIECMCAACVVAAGSASGVFEQQEKLRSEAFGMVVTVSDVLAELESYDPREKVYTTAETQQGPDLEDLNEVTKTLMRLVANLTQTGGPGNPEQIRWYNVLIDRVQPHVAAQLDDDEKLGYWRYICRQACKVEELALGAFGADSNEYMEAKSRREGLDGVVKEEKGRVEMVRRGG